MGAPQSHYAGRKVLVSTTGLDNPIEGVLLGLKQEPLIRDAGQWCYEIELENGDLMLLPVTDLCYMVLKTDDTVKIFDKIPLSLTPVDKNSGPG